MTTQNMDAERERDLLAEAIGRAAVESGIYRDGVAMTGPQLLMACDDMAKAIKSSQAEDKFKVVAYQEITPSADDPEVLDAKLWALPPGHAVPDGCVPLYWKKS